MTLSWISGTILRFKGHLWPVKLTSQASRSCLELLAMQCGGYNWLYFNDEDENDEDENDEDEDNKDEYDEDDEDDEDEDD